MLTSGPSWSEVGIWGKNKLAVVNCWVKGTAFLSIGEVFPSTAGLLSARSEVVSAYVSMSL